MAAAGHHPLLDTRLEALAARIAGLQEKLGMARGMQRADRSAALKQLESRHARLAQRLREIEGDASHGAVEELSVMADDLTAAVRDLIAGLEAPIGPAPHER